MFSCLRKVGAAYNSVSFYSIGDTLCPTPRLTPILLHPGHPNPHPTAPHPNLNSSHLTPLHFDPKFPHLTSILNLNPASPIPSSPHLHPTSLPQPSQTHLLPTSLILFRQVTTSHLILLLTTAPHPPHLTPTSPHHARPHLVQTSHRLIYCEFSGGISQENFPPQTTSNSFHRHHSSGAGISMDFDGFQ